MRRSINSTQFRDLCTDLLYQADKLQTLISAAKIEVEPIWTQLFAKVRSHCCRTIAIEAHTMR